MSKDYETITAYNALTEQQKQQLPLIHRRVNVASLVVLIPLTILDVVWGVGAVGDFFSYYFSSGDSFSNFIKYTDMIIDFKDFLVINVAGWLAIAIINAISRSVLSSKYPFYTKELGEYSIELNRNGEGPQSVSGAVESLSGKPASPPVIIESPKPSTIVCPDCGKEQTSNRMTCFCCGRLFVE